VSAPRSYLLPSLGAVVLAVALLASALVYRALDRPLQGAAWRGAPPSAPGISPSVPIASPADPVAGLVAGVRGQVASYLADRGRHAAVAALDLNTGAELTYNASVRFETASIVKVDILAALLWQRQEEGGSGGEAELTAGQRTLAMRMITQSDNDAADDLYEQVGGATGLTRANRAFGLTDTTPQSSWGLTRTTVSDQLRLLRVVSRPGPLAAPSRAYILDLMSQVERDQRWGVPAAAGEDATAVYVKNGWLSRSADRYRWIINSIGRIVEPGHDWLIVVLTNLNATMDAGVDLVQATANLALDGLRRA
jgi:hypothetical protein